MSDEKDIQQRRLAERRARLLALTGDVRKLMETLKRDLPDEWVFSRIEEVLLRRSAARKLLSVAQSRFRERLVAVSCCVLFFWTPARAYYFGRTTDTTPIQISLRDKAVVRTFSIPKNYMTFSENWAGGAQDFIVVEVRFPSMMPVDDRSPSTSDLVVRVHSFARTGANFSTEKTVEFYKSERWSFAGEFLDKDGHSYERYLEKRQSHKLHSRQYKEFFVEADGKRYLECLHEDQNREVGCSLFSDYGESLSLVIQFKRSQFERWPAFYSAVVNLLDSFRSISK
jgi:hypothetical protein